MSLLQFPCEVTFQIIRKLDYFNRLNLSVTHSRLIPLCFDRLLNRNFLTVNELLIVHQQSKNEKERDECFNPKILDRIRMKNFNEVVHLRMDSKNIQFFANNKILNCFDGKIVLEGENEEFSDVFYQTFISLLDRIEQNICLVLVDVKNVSKTFAEDCAIILSSKLQVGKKVSCINVCKTIRINDSLGREIYQGIGMDDLTMYYDSESSDGSRDHYLQFKKKNSATNMKTLIHKFNEDKTLIYKLNDDKTLISKFNKDRLKEEKQHLVSVLPLVKAAELPGSGRRVLCGQCGAVESSIGNQIWIWIKEPDWSNCSDCLLK